MNETECGTKTYKACELMHDVEPVTAANGICFSFQSNGETNV